MTSRVSSRSDDSHGAGTALRFEPIGPQHAGALEELFARCQDRAVTDTFDPFPLDREQARRIALEPRRDRYYLAFAEGGPAGMSMLRGFDEGYAVPSFGVFVAPNLHGRGIGRALTSWTVAAARELGCASVRLSVYASNTRAVRLYESLGFVAQDSSEVRRAAGLDRKVVMTLALQAPS